MAVGTAARPGAAQGASRGGWWRRHSGRLAGPADGGAGPGSPTGRLSFFGGSGRGKTGAGTGNSLHRTAVILPSRESVVIKAAIEHGTGR